jgi:hypothetical protein
LIIFKKIHKALTNRLLIYTFIKPILSTMKIPDTCARQWLPLLIVFSLLININSVLAQKKQAKTTVAPAPPAKSVISLKDYTQTIALDTFKSAVTKKYTLKVLLVLSKGTPKDTSVTIIAKPQLPFQNIRLADDDDFKTYKVDIDAEDWNATKDTTVTKGINLTIQHLEAITDEQNIILHIKDKPGREIVTLQPYKPKVKPEVKSKLIALGKAEIIGLSNVGIVHTYGSVLNAIDTITVRVKLRGKYEKEKAQLSFYFLNDSLSKNFKILENPITISEADWNNARITEKDAVAKNNAKIKAERDAAAKQANDEKISVKTDAAAKPANDEKISAKIDTTAKPANDEETDTVAYRVINIPLHIKTISVDDSLVHTQYLDMVLKGQTTVSRGSQRVKVSLKDNSFWAEMGTNFDLLDNIKTNNFYAGVFMFDKDVARIFRRGNNTQKNLSFIGGVYEAQSVSAGATTSQGILYRTTDKVYQDTGVVKATTSVKTIGILFSPMVRLNRGKVEDNGFHIFGSVYTELVWQTIKSDFNYDNVGRYGDSLFVYKPVINKIPFREKNTSYDFRSSYLGLGFPMYIKETDFNLFVNTTFGLTNQRYTIRNSRPNKLSEPDINDPVNYIEALTFSANKSRWNPFYVVQFRLNASAYGITFSGEIRGLIITESKPVVTLAVSKKFNISNLFGSVLGKDSNK